MANKVISVNRKKYAVGLFWQPVGVAVSGRNYARTLARNINRKLNLFIEYKSMIGLGARRDGQRVGMVSAAAEVMESFSEYTSFLAMFQVGKQFYLVAARNGVVLFDAVFDSEDDARAEYVKLSEIPDWGAFFAPSAWGMPRAAERNLADLLNVRSRNVLHSISHFKAGLFSVALIGLFLLLVLWLFREPLVQVFTPKPQVQQLDPELVAEYKRQIEEKNKELDEQFEIEKVAPPPPIVMPFELLPNVDARAKQCYQAIGFMMQPVTGWNQVFVECNEAYVIAEFRRGFGTLGEFYSIAADLMPGAFVQEINENTLRVQAKLPELDVFASQDERDADTIVRDVMSAFQSVDTDIDVQTVVDTLTNGVDVATVNVVEIGVKSKLVPMQFMKVFDEFGGVYLMKCEWDVASRLWNYEVIIYAK